MQKKKKNLLGYQIFLTLGDQRVKRHTLINNLRQIFFPIQLTKIYEWFMSTRLLKKCFLKYFEKKKK